jgi:Helix-turn-helix
MGHLGCHHPARRAQRVLLFDSVFPVRLNLHRLVLDRVMPKKSKSRTGRRKSKVNPRTVGEAEIEMGRRIREQRDKLKLTQEELGEKLGVSFQQVQNTKRASTGSLPHACRLLPKYSVSTSLFSMMATPTPKMSTAYCFSTALLICECCAPIPRSRIKRCSTSLSPWSS